MNEKAKNIRDELTAEDMAAFEPDAKIGLLATVNPEGLPHLTLITTIRAKTPTRLTWGQFSEGKSKENVRLNPHTAFLVMNARREVWRGTALWTGSAKQGEDFERYNKAPMFRYNAYFGIHTVHTMDLVTATEKGTLSLPRMIAGYTITAAVRHREGSPDAEPVLKPWAVQTVDKIGTLKFLSWIGPNGFPILVGPISCQTAGSGRLVFASTAYRDSLHRLPRRQVVALMALTMNMESVLVRGPFEGYRRHLGLEVGVIDIDWVYNSMPPVPGQIFPELPLEAVVAG